MRAAVSNVTGEGLSNLKLFLNVVTPAGSAFPTDADFEFTISDCFSVPFVGTVVSGIILGGSVACCRDIRTATAVN